MTTHKAQQTPTTLFAGVLHRKGRMSMKSMRARAETVWTHFLIWFPLAALVVLGWSAYLFFGINSESIFVGSDEGPGLVETINQGELRSALDFFDVRARNFEILRTTSPDTVDPAVSF